MRLRVMGILWLCCAVLARVSAAPPAEDAVSFSAGYHLPFAYVSARAERLSPDTRQGLPVVTITCVNHTEQPLTVTMFDCLVLQANGAQLPLLPPVMQPGQPITLAAPFISAQLAPHGVATLRVDPRGYSYAPVEGVPYLLRLRWRVAHDEENITVDQVLPYLLPPSVLDYASPWETDNNVQARLHVLVTRGQGTEVVAEIKNLTKTTLSFSDVSVSKFVLKQRGTVIPLTYYPVAGTMPYYPHPVLLPPGADIQLSLYHDAMNPDTGSYILLNSPPQQYVLSAGAYDCTATITAPLNGNPAGQPNARQWSLTSFTLIIPEHKQAI